ncbi:MAG TPA: Imm40 family immunity protein [Chitinophagaceae bacterium]|nr:Imm40 family immunity protein [Chitinophagaceae bacterium]
MEIVWSDRIDEVLRVGRQLNAIGLRNWALTKPQALIALEKFSEFGIPVLGGDVYENIEGVIRPNYDSWHCDPLSDEDKVNFIKRSISTAERYIQAYPIKDPNKIFFALVPEV